MPCIVGLWNGGGSSGWMGGVGMVLWWGLAIVALVALLRWLAGQFGAGTRGTSARAILEERYARGELSKAEFEEKRRDLDARS